MKMELQEFEEAIRKDDFAIGDSFWLGDWEFEVVNYRINGKSLCEDEVVFKWQLTRQDFIEVIRKNFPEIQNPEEFFDQNKDDIIHYFEKGFDVLVGECGATYETVIADAVGKVQGGNKNAIEQIIEYPDSEQHNCQDIREYENSKAAKQDSNDLCRQQRHNKACMDYSDEPTQMAKGASIAGRQILDIYTCTDGRRWFVTKKAYRNGRQILSGYVSGSPASGLAKFYGFPGSKLRGLDPRIWKVARRAWHYLPEVKTIQAYLRQQGNGSNRAGRVYYRSLESYLV